MNLLFVEEIMLRFLTGLVLFFTIVFTSGCGFKLRGSVEFPPQLRTICLQSSSAGNLFSSKLEDRLIASQVKLVNANDRKAIRLIITSANSKVAQIGVGDNQQTRYYNVVYTVHFKLEGADGRELLPTTSVSDNANIALLPQEIITNNNKRTIAEEQLMDSVVEKIIYRLNSAQVIKAVK